MRACPPPGTYKHLHNSTQALVATAFPEAFACILGTHEMDSSFEGADLDSDTQVDRWEHEPLLALTGSMGMQPVSTNEALKGPDADAWKQTLEQYKPIAKIMHLGYCGQTKQ
jgi:hypothetical protein